MEFGTLVMFMGIFYFMVFILSYVENVLEQRRSRNFARSHLSSGCAAANYTNKTRSPSPDELPYYDSASGRRSGPAVDVYSQEGNAGQQRITRMTIETSSRDDKRANWPPSDSETTFECYPRGNQWICSPVDDESKVPDTWEDSHESVPHCLHGQDKIDSPRLRRQKSKEF